MRHLGTGRHLIRRLGGAAMALLMVSGSLSGFTTAKAEGESKWTAEETEDGWMKVTQEGGPTLGYTEGTGVTILEVDGYAFKDLDKDGELDDYEDWRLDAQERAEDLAGRLSIKQIAGLRYTAKDPGASSAAFEADLNQEVRHFLGNALESSDVDIVTEAVNEMQAMAEASEFGIPVIPSMDPPSSYMNKINALSMAASFDTEMVTELYNQTAIAMRAIGIFEMLGPQSDLSSEPRWTRIGSTFGEDPALVRDMSKAAVTGLQSTFDEDGNDLGWGVESVISQVKHFPSDGAAEGGRESHTDPGKYNVYPGDAFETGLIGFFDGAFALDSSTETAAAVMPSYSIAWDKKEKYGELVGSNFSEYKIKLLRENGFDGIISTDSLIMPDNTAGVPTISVHGMDGKSSQEVIYQILKIGVDRILMPDFGEDPSYLQQIADAYDIMVEEEGKEFADKNYYDSAVRLLRAYFKTGAFENPYTDTEYAIEVIEEGSISESFTDKAQKTIVMLKNSNGAIKERSELPTVYIPMEFSAGSAGNSSAAGRPAGWSLPIDEKLASQYMNIVTDTVTEPSGTTEDGDAVYTEADIIRATEEELAACDFAVAFISGPSTGSGYSNGTYYPMSLQYGEYVADGENVRKKSLSQGIIETYVQTPYQTQVNRTKDDRNYSGQSTVASNLSDLELVKTIAAQVPESCDVVVCVTVSKPMIFSEFEADVDTILMSFGVAEENFLPILGGQVEPTALLPLQMPADMDTVEGQYEDVPRDMVCYVDADGNTYDFTFGMNWNGVIDDERVATYNVPALTEPAAFKEAEDEPEVVEPAENEPAEAEPETEPVEVSELTYHFFLNEDGEVYSEGSFAPGSRIKNPGTPEMEGSVFAGWYDSTEYTGTFSDMKKYDSDVNFYAKWLNMFVFEAENTQLTDLDPDEDDTCNMMGQKLGQSYSGNVAGKGLINGCACEASGDQYVTNLYYNGAFLQFEIESDRDTDDAILYLRLSGEFTTINLTDKTFVVTVNGEAISYGTIELVGGTTDDLTSNARRTMTDHSMGIVSLKEGENVICLTVNNSEKQFATGTMDAAAPMIDCIKINTSANLTMTEYDN